MGLHTIGLTFDDRAIASFALDISRVGEASAHV